MKKLRIILSMLGCICLMTNCGEAQEAPQFIVEPETVSLDYKKDTCSNIICVSIIQDMSYMSVGDEDFLRGLNWTLGDYPDWLTINNNNKEGGVGKSFLDVTVKENTSSERRSASIVFNLRFGSEVLSSVSVKIIQEGAPHFLTRWYPTNCGTGTNGDGYYRWDLLSTNPCPQGYRVPTKDEFDRLLNECPSKWVDQGPGSVSGRWFCPGTEATNNPSTESGCVFFPAAGSRYLVSNNQVHDPDNLGSDGYYWSSAAPGTPTDKAYSLHFTRDAANVVDEYWKATGGDGGTMWHTYSVRCISQES